MALSPGMKQYIEAKTKHPNIIAITNAANLTLFSKTQPFVPIDPSLAPKNYAIYTGNVGLVNNSYLLLNAAKYIQSSQINNLKILIVGDGPLMDEFKE